jgi:ribosomal-protein-alanine N-acetyltransferase
VRRIEVLHIVPMASTDIDAVVDIENHSSPAPWPAQLFLEDLARDWAHVDLARLAGDGGGPGQVVGFASYWLVHDELHLLNLAAHPEHRRRGVGRRLMGHLIAVAHDRGSRYITLEVRRGNLAAQALYHGHGFEAVGMRARYYSDGEDAIVMTLTLAGQPSDPSRF